MTKNYTSKPEIKDMNMPELLREMLELDDIKSYLKSTLKRIEGNYSHVESRLANIMEGLGAPSMKVVHPWLNVALASWAMDEASALKIKAKRDKGPVERSVGMRSQYWASLEKDPEVHGLSSDQEVFRKALGYFRQLGFGDKLQPMLHTGALSSVVRERIENAVLLPGQDPCLALPPSLRNLISVSRVDKLAVTKTANQSNTSKSMSARRG